MKNTKLKKLINEGMKGKVEFPMISECSKCHGVIGYFDPKTNKRIEDKSTGMAIAFMRHGYWLNEWEGKNVGNSRLYPYECSCKCRHEYQEIHGERKLYAMEHHYRCKNCGDEMVVDSSG
jgi:hypothetical protein